MTEIENIRVQELWDIVMGQMRMQPFNSETVSTFDDIEHSPTTMISEDDFISRINRLQRRIVGDVKAQHLPNLIESFSDTTLPANAHRILPSRVFVDSVRAVFRPWDTWRRLASSKFRGVTAAFPIFSFESNRFDTCPDGILSYYAVTYPADVSAMSDSLELDVRFLGAMVALLCMDIWMTKNMTHPELDSMLEVWELEYEDEILPYRRTNRYSLLNDREVDVEI